MEKMKIHLYSWYDHFTLTQTPKYIDWVRTSAPLSFYSDSYITEPIVEDNACALLIEPRSIQPRICELMEKPEMYNQFRYVFTHDQKLLDRLPNAKPIIWGGVYEYNDIEKTKDISMVSSDKRMCDLHIKRLELAKQLEYKIDCMGNYRGGNKVDTKTIYAPYRFSVVVENYIEPYWWSEKICNCFANKTIPIYYGSPDITKWFNKMGIIQVKELNEIPDIIDNLIPELAYSARLSGVEDNYERVKQYTCFEDTFYMMYKDLLEELADEH